MDKKILYLIIGLIIVAFALFAVNKLLKEEVVEEPTAPEVVEEELVEIISINNIDVPDQAPGNEVFVGKVLLKTEENGGFVIIHRATEDGEVGDIIGVSQYLTPGVTENFVVTLNEGEVVEIDETVIAMLHADDGDGVWNSETDISIINSEGDVVMSAFTIIDNLEEVPGFEAKL